MRVQNSVARSDTSSCTSLASTAPADGGARVLEHERVRSRPTTRSNGVVADLAVIGEDVEVVAVLGHRAHGAAILRDGVVDAAQVVERQLGVGAAAVRVLVVAEVVEVDDAARRAARRRSRLASRRRA